MEILVLHHGLELAAIDAHLLDLRSGRLDALSNISLEVYKLPVLDTPKLIQEVLKVFDEILLVSIHVFNHPIYVIFVENKLA